MYFNFESYETKGGSKEHFLSTFKDKYELENDSFERLEKGIESFNKENNTSFDLYDYLKYNANNMKFKKKENLDTKTEAKIVHETASETASETVPEKPNETEAKTEPEKPKQIVPDRPDFAKTEPEKKDFKRVNDLSEYEEDLKKRGFLESNLKTLGDVAGAITGIDVFRTKYDKENMAKIDENIKNILKQGGSYEDLNELEKRYLQYTKELESVSDLTSLPNVFSQSPLDYAKEKFKNVKELYSDDDKKAKLAFDKEKALHDALNVKDVKDLSPSQKALVDEYRGGIESFFVDKFRDDEYKQKSFDELKEKYEAQNYISKDVVRKVEFLKNIHKATDLTSAFLGADEKDRKDYENAVNDIAVTAGFDEALVDDETGKFYFSKDGKTYLVNDGFFDNFFDILQANSLSMTGGLVGAYKGFEKGKGVKGKIVNSIAGAGAGSFLGASGDVLVTNYLLDRENSFDELLRHSLQEGVLSVVGDTAVVAAKPIVSGTANLIKQNYKKVADYMPVFSTLNNLPTQNIKAAQDLVEKSVDLNTQKELDEFYKTYGARSNLSDSKALDGLVSTFKAKFGDDSILTKQTQKLNEILNLNSLSHKQNALFEAIRADESGFLLPYVKEVASYDVRAFKNLKNILNLSTQRLESSLKNMNLNKGDIKNILDDLEKGTKEDYNEVMNEILAKTYDDRFKVVLNRGEAEENVKNIKANELKEVLAKMDLSPQANANKKERFLTGKIGDEEAKILQKEFSFKNKKPLVREIDSHQIIHTLKQHGDEALEKERGNIAVNLDDIANYQQYTKDYDLRIKQDNGKIIYAKQVNGHYVVVEEVLSGQDKLRFFDMWKGKGKINKNVLLSRSVTPEATSSLNLDSVMTKTQGDNKDFMSSPKILTPQGEAITPLSEKPSVFLDSTSAEKSLSNADVLNPSLARSQVPLYSDNEAQTLLRGFEPDANSFASNANYTTFRKNLQEQGLDIDRGERNILKLKTDLKDEDFFKQRDKIIKDLKANKGEVINSYTNESAILSNAGIKKMLSDKAIAKSVDNGFSKMEHLQAVANIKELFRNSKKLISKGDTKNSDNNLIINRYVSDLNVNDKEARALLTLKEYNENGKRFYSLELENLEPLSSTKRGVNGDKDSFFNGDRDTPSFSAQNNYTTFRKNLQEQGLLDEEALKFLNYVENTIYNPKGVTFSQLNNALKNINSFYKQSTNPSFKEHIKNAVENFLRDDIKKGINEIFKQDKNLYAKASKLYETSLSEYAQMKELLKASAYKKARNESTTQEKALDELIRYAKGQGKNSLNNLDFLRAKLDDKNVAVLEMNLLNRLYEKSIAKTDDSLRVFDSESFLNELSTLQNNAFKSKEANDFIELVKGFNTLFKNDAKIALDLAPSTAKKEGSALATSARGAVLQKIVKSGFDLVFRNLGQNVLFGSFKDQIQGAALRYHLKKALQKSDTISEFNTSFKDRLKKGQFNSKTRELSKDFLNDVENFSKNLDDEVLKDTKASDESLKDLPKENVNKEVAEATPSDTTSQKNYTKIKNEVNENTGVRELEDIKFSDTKGKEHTLTKETQEQWLKTFELENLEQSYIPKHSEEIKEALGKEIRLQKGSLLKLVSQGRKDYIPQIKAVLDEPDLIIKEPSDEILLAKHLKDEDYFVNVSFDNGEYLVSISNGIKETRNLKNKLNAGAKVIYQSPNANSISQTLLQTSQYSANKIDKDNSTTNPASLSKTRELEDIKFSDTKGKEHTLTKETQEQWLKTFELENLEQSYIPKHSEEIKEALGKEIRLTKGSLLKLVSKEREQYIPQIKETLDNPDFVLKDVDNMIILAKKIDDKQYFTSINLETDEFLISVSNAPKKENVLKNKIEKGAKVIYQSPNSESIFYTPELLQASQSLANKIDKEHYTTNTPDLQTHPSTLESNLQFDSHQAFVMDKKSKEAWAKILQDFSEQNTELYRKEGYSDNYFRMVSINELFKHLTNFNAKTDKEFLKESYSYLERHIKDANKTFWKQEKITADKLEELRQYLQQRYNIKPIPEFGKNYAEYIKNPYKAIEKILLEKQGQVAGAFHKEGLGDIDLVWGDSSMGLSHILERRTQDFIKEGLSKEQAEIKAREFVEALPELIEKGEVEKIDKRAFIHFDNKKGVIALDYKGDDSRKWLVTAYNKNDTSTTPANPHQSGFADKDFSTSSKSEVNPNSTTNSIKLQANQHIGTGLASGTISGLETDENGNIIGFDPQKFALGFLGGSAGSIAFKKGKDFLDKNPKYKEAIKKELADTLAQGFENASKKYPMLDMLKPIKFNIMQSEKGRIAQAGHLLNKIEKQEIHIQRETTKELLSKIVGQDITNANDGVVAQVSKKNISKMLSDKAIAKSVNNGFSELEHIEAVKDIQELYKKANFIKTHKDLKHNNPAIIIHRYKAKVDKNTEALITLKETIDGKYKGNKIYTLELEGLQNVGK